MNTMVAAENGGRKEAGKAALAGWVLYDWAAQPFFTLIFTFIFGPYFVARLAASPEVGQAWWTGATAAAGLVIAILSPILGAFADATGPRKPWIALFSVFYVVGSAALWWASPTLETGFLIALVGYVLATIGAEFGIVFTNAMMPDLVGREKMGRLSGIGWGVGYAGGLLALIIMLGLVIPGENGRTMFGLPSILGFSHDTYAGERFVGPFTAMWYLVFVLPLFLFTPDAPKRASAREAIRNGLKQLQDTLSGWREHRNAFLYLLASMSYKDALVGVFALGGIVGAAVFGWPIMVVGIFGLIINLVGVFGSFIGGWLDDKLGSKPVIIGGILVLFFATVTIMTLGRDYVFGVIAVPPPPEGGGLFAGVSEKVFLIAGILVGLAVGPLQAASRTLLVSVAPKDKITEFFGLYALTGKATSFLVPMAISATTALSGSFRIGLTPILVFFAIGLTLLLMVREPLKPARAARSA